LEANARETQHLEQERARRDAIRTNCDQVMARLRDAFIPELLEGLITGGFLHQARVTAKPHDGESLREALLRTRFEIEQAKGELVTVRAAPPPRDVCRASAPRRSAAADLRGFAARHGRGRQR
jgi:hypothetical protein